MSNYALPIQPRLNDRYRDLLSNLLQEAVDNTSGSPLTDSGLFIEIKIAIDKIPYL